MIGDVWCSSVDKKISFGLGDIFARGLRVEVIMTTGVLTYATSPSMYFFFNGPLSLSSFFSCYGCRLFNFDSRVSYHYLPTTCTGSVLH